MKIITLPIIFLLFFLSCSNNNEKSPKSPKSYEPKTSNPISESLPEEKVEINIATPEPISDPTFRKVKWGMTKDDVKARESGPVFSESATLLSYDNVQVNGLDTYVGYMFIDNKLHRGVYAFKKKHVNEDMYITDYNSLKDILISKYGPPTQDQKTWLEDSDYYRDRPGDAVSMSKLIYYAIWETEDTIISLSLMGENYQPMLRIEYDSTDPELKKLLDEAKQKQNQSDF